jgi:AcrR family transcriptional regulator
MSSKASQAIKATKPAGSKKVVRAPAGDQDGRRRRSQDSRARIVTAMLELIHGGDVAPGAEQVAARAQVGLRTVFRHFDDMDSLYSEMSHVIENELRAVVARPFKSEDWRSRVVEFVERRSYAFERIGPYKHAANLRRHSSPFLEAAHTRLVKESRKILEHQIPSEFHIDPNKLEALDLLLSFEVWSRLRHEQGLSVRRAREVLEGVARRLLDL